MRFKFRAECYSDVERLLAVIPKKEVKFSDIFPDEVLPDVEVIIDLSDHLSLEDIRNYMRQVIDGRVMVETVQLEEKYTGDRDDYWREQHLCNLKQYMRNLNLN